MFMKTDKNILMAFILNFTFSIFEFLGGLFIGSIAIISDAVHDAGDAISIGIAYILEKKSQKQPDEKYTYGYARFSVMGSAITTIILLISSIAVIFNAINRIMNPAEINYNGMIIFAFIGVCVNSSAFLITFKGHSLNQKAVNLHLMEDVLGWVVVLSGAIIMRFTDFRIIDPIMSIGVAVFILICSAKNLKEVAYIFLEKAPDNLKVAEIINNISNIDGVIDVHHLHLWSVDGNNIYATMHIITNSDTYKIKEIVRKKLMEMGICHTTLELETAEEKCNTKCCYVEHTDNLSTHRHHH